MGKALRIDCPDPQTWWWPPDGRFVLERGENHIADFDALPENIRRKIRFFVKSGYVRVIGDTSALDSAGIQANTNDATADIAAATGDGTDQPAPPSDVASGRALPEAPDAGIAANDSSDMGAANGDREATATSARVLRFRRFFDGLGRTLVHQFRATIILSLIEHGAMGTSKLSRVLARPRQTVSEHVAVLERAGILKYEQAGRRFSVDPDWLERVDRLVNVSDEPHALG
jgi:DNA-binding transcriptional ArsR family regulator